MITSILAQDNPPKPLSENPLDKPQSSATIQVDKIKKTNFNIANRANDHFLVQFGYAGWAGTPDSINTGGFSKSFNVYFMFDFPFKTNPKLSIAFGPGIGSDHIVFKKTYVGIKELTPTLQFRDQSDTNHFKKTKLATAYLEAPIEFRYTAHPERNGKGLKFALGLKVGTMISAHTRNKILQSPSGGTLNDYMLKEASKHYFNTTRFSGMARVGLGHISLFGSYQITTLFKEGYAADIRPFSIGLTLSGL
jgi:hypothetical protein